MEPTDDHRAARDASRDRFDALADFFDAIRVTASHRELTDAVLAETRDAPAGRALELGSGAGAALFGWRDDDRPLVALDVAPTMLGRARANTGAAPVQADVAELPFADGSFAVLGGALYLQLVGDQTRAHREALRVLIPRGRYATVVPSVTWDTEAAKRLARARGVGDLEAQFFLGCAGTAVSTRRYDEAGLRTALEGAGFVEVRTRPLLEGYVLVASGRRPPDHPVS